MTSLPVTPATVARKRAKRRRTALVVRLDRALRYGALALCAATFLGYLGRLWWVLDLLSPFRPLLAVLLVPTTALLFWRRHRVLGSVAAAALGGNLFVLLPYLILSPSERISPDAQRLKIFHANVLAPNNTYEELLSQIVQENPDVITLTELTPGWMSGLKTLHTQYPYVVHNETQDRFGLAIWSRYPLVRTEAQYLGVRERCAVLAQLQLNKRSLTVVAAHPWSPRSAEWAQSRDDQLELLGERVKDEHGPVVLVGDLNVTPWSAGFQSLLETSELRDSQRDQGLTPTWPARFPLRIPIDHCLVSEHVHILSRHTGEDFGSDHLPLVVTVAVE